MNVKKLFKTDWLFLMVVFLLVSKCVFASTVLIDEKKVNWTYKKFEALLPLTWIKFHTSGNSLLLLTKDGTPLNKISVSRMKLTEELESSKKKLKEDMMIHEVAQTILDDISLDLKVQNFNLLNNELVDVGEIEMFKIIYEFNNPKKMKYKAIKYGFIYNKYFYSIDFVAERESHYNKYVNDFMRYIKAF